MMVVRRAILSAQASYLHHHSFLFFLRNMRRDIMSSKKSPFRFNDQSWLSKNVELRFHVFPLFRSSKHHHTVFMVSSGRKLASSSLSAVFPIICIYATWLRSHKQSDQTSMAGFRQAFSLLSFLSFIPNFLSLSLKKTDGSYHVLQKAQEFALWPVLAVQKEVRNLDVFRLF